MATAFTRTLRRLDSTGFKRPIRTAAVVGVVLGAWTAWGLLVHVTIYEVSTQARLEVGRAVHSVEAPAGGRVIESRMTLGQEVVAGEVLLRLDSDTQQYALREEREKLAALDPELRRCRPKWRALRKLVRTSPVPRRPRPKNPARACAKPRRPRATQKLNWSASRNFAPNG